MSDPLLGHLTLRKFKIAVAHPNENCVDVFAQDIGLIPHVDDERGAGFVVLVGVDSDAPTRRTTHSLAWPIR